MDIEKLIEQYQKAFEHWRKSGCVTVTRQMRWKKQNGYWGRGKNVCLSI